MQGKKSNIAKMIANDFELLRYKNEHERSGRKIVKSQGRFEGAVSVVTMIGEIDGGYFLNEERLSRTV
jgi:hypothetical protein